MAATNKEFNIIIDVQKEAIEETGEMSPGMLLIDDSGKCYFMSMIYPLAEYEDVGMIIKQILIPAMQNDGPTYVTDYYLCVSKETYLRSKHDDGDLRIEHKDPKSIHVDKIMVFYGNHDREEIREYWLPTFKEDKSTRLKRKTRSKITTPLTEFMIPDPGMFRANLISDITKSELTSKSYIYKK
jgi:hypothetical protein